MYMHLYYNINYIWEVINLNFFKKAVSAVKRSNVQISNPYYLKNSFKNIKINEQKIIALLHFGRSGTGLLHSLIDNHSEISTLPSIYLSQFFDNIVWKKLSITVGIR